MFPERCWLLTLTGFFALAALASLLVQLYPGKSKFNQSNRRSSEQVRTDKGGSAQPSAKSDQTEPDKPKDGSDSIRTNFELSRTNSSIIWGAISDGQFWQTVATVALAVFTFVLIGISSKQNEINVATQRANVTLGRGDGAVMELVPPVVGKPLLVAMYFLNSGHVVAENFFARAIISIADEGPVSPEGWSFGPEPKPTPDPVHGGITSFISAPIGAGVVQVVIAGNPKPLTSELAAELARGQRAMTVQGKFEYDDGFGLHWTKNFSASFNTDARRFIIGRGFLPDQSRPINPGWRDRIFGGSSDKPIRPRMGTVTVGPKPTRIWPPENPQPPSK
jgi:hypothetical protein